MSEFLLYPAIDMRGGKCVRLLQGDYNQETVYGDSPFDMAKQFAEAGAKWIHMVDLDGAKAGERVNHQHAVRVAKELQVSVQIGGGIRTEEDVAFYLEEGVNRVILGSAAISNPEFVLKMLRTYGEQIAIGIDARDGYVATEGWLNMSEIKAADLAERLSNEGAETFIFTDISKDGTLQGPNTEAIGQLAGLTGKNVIASGGISSLADLEALKKDHRGIGGAIIGKALYTGRLTLEEALEKVK
ncbi:1-(5-phosphoribosyl)-5-[(5-phosphoribosylamino)methylideneamino]imidazole-4-carboxamide isomerase [Fictibacillus sp. KU28468]|uniref:1-(5-phosphoribosyl)-5-[(5- phosphoribosylamino)methylideneamino]imidazole-4- carboxamide isomerase n=1 Tax=Fictibacillus sp. KU28468 TaxID=2991053 RepID=UPI00223DA5E2|nr:1-(5-phosphoribosyl)-5-[(5-phosphoribosylamino)methylideneamino]imidazole-4-carboxamide isomerase [Fictibacillus sp. KU28468]UZJ79791.1 1-(5-phosphoribosyl)-5-[(5-phosphoribosylamino)methylideneamino]imidazole-4-carboxamide isomerase [Fictibacillus sp. KU28468]